MTTKNDLKTLLPGSELKVAGELITIQPLRFIDLPKAAILAGKLGNLFFDVLAAVKSKPANLDALSLLDMTVMAAEKGIEIPEVIRNAEDEVRAFLVDALADDAGFGVRFKDGTLSVEEGTVDAITALLEHGGDALMEFVKLCARRDQEWLESLDYGEGIEVIFAIVEVNLDFFKTRLAPQLTGRLQTFTKMMAQEEPAPKKAAPRKAK